VLVSLDIGGHHRNRTYFVKDVRFHSLEYVLFLGMAIQGLIGWRKEVGGYGKEEYEEAGIGFGEVRPAA